jgi:ribulose-bisphosphate carboxylase large chain
MPDERICATYCIETALPLEQVLDTMLGLQGTGGFVKLPGETDALRERHGRRVEQISEQGGMRRAWLARRAHAQECLPARRATFAAPT